MGWLVGGDTHIGRSKETILHEQIFSFLLAHVSFLHGLIRHETKVNVWEVGPILCSSTKGLSVTYAWISSFDTLDLVLDESVVSRWDSLSLLRGSVNYRRIRNLVDTSHWHDRLIGVGLINQHTGRLAANLLQKIIMRRKERVSVMNLISGRKKQCAHVDGQEVGAVTASNRNGLEHTSARHAHREDSVTKVANDVTELVGGGRRDVVR